MTTSPEPTNTTRTTATTAAADPDHGPDLINLVHLDDDGDFAPDEKFRALVKRRGTRLRRRRKRVTALSSAIAMVILVTAMGGVAKWRTSQIARVALSDIVQVDPAGAPITPNPMNPRAPFNVLVVGTDDRPGTDRGTPARSDSMMIVRVDMAAGTIRMVSLPRDLWVTIADGSGQERLNTAIAKNPETLIRTVNQTFGVLIDHFVLVTFGALASLVDAVGGLPIELDASIRDFTTGLDLTAGCRVLSGEQVLALARSRHGEWQGPNGWSAIDATSDLGRQRRQQLLAEALVRQPGRRSASIGGFAELARLATDQLTLDDRLGSSDLIELARWSQSLGPDAVTSTIPKVQTRFTRQGGAVLDLAPSAAAEVRSFLNNGTSDPPVGAGPAFDQPIRMMRAKASC